MDNYWPNLFVPGAAKSGTTTLHYCLNQHPDIWMSADKEPVFFSRSDRYHSTKNRNYYLSLFHKGRNHLYRGESSTDYMMCPEVIPRIKTHARQPKFIFILRNPIDRAFSHYSWLAGKGLEERPFMESFKQDFRDWSVSSRRPSYYRVGCYGELLRPYYNEFGEENIHVMVTEDFNHHPKKIMNTCFAFLGLPPLDNFNVPVLNPTVTLSYPGFYRTIRQALLKEPGGWLKGLYQDLLPDGARIKIRRWVLGGLKNVSERMGQRATRPRLEEAARQQLTGYYADDVSMLRELTSQCFAQWHDFTFY